MDYDVRIDQSGDTWVVHTLPNGGKVEVNKTKLDAYQQRPQEVIFDEAAGWYERMRENAEKQKRKR